VSSIEVSVLPQDELELLVFPPLDEEVELVLVFHPEDDVLLLVSVELQPLVDELELVDELFDEFKELTISLILLKNSSSTSCSNFLFFNSHTHVTK
jgi:hypothetical protein